MKKITVSIIILAIIFSSFGGSFLNKVEAKKTAAERAATKMAIAGASCFLAAKIEKFVNGLAARLEAWFEGQSVKTQYPLDVPVNVANLPAVAKSAEADSALSDSKKCIRDVVVKSFIDTLVDATVEWIQNGGDPRFITNFDNFLEDASNLAFNRVVNKTALKGLCSPFGLQIKIGLLPVEKFSEQITCTLDQVVGNINNFYVDFSVGGWTGYNKMWEAQNNYYGAIMMIADKIAMEEAKEKELKRIEAATGGGFKPDKICKAGSIITPQIHCKVFIGTTEYKTCIDEEDIKYAGYARDRNNKYCDSKNLIAVTPGSTIGQAAANAINADSWWASNIQSWSTALVNAAINRLTSEGLSIMRDSLTAEDTGTASSFNPTLTSNSTRATYVNQKISGYNDIIGKISDIISVKNNTLSAINSSTAMLKDIQTYYCSYNKSFVYTSEATSLIPALTPNNGSTIIQKITDANLASSIIALDVASLQTFYNTASSSIIAYAKSITKYTDDEIIIIDKDYTDFYSKDKTLINDIIGGISKTSTDSKYAIWLSHLSDIQTVNNSCR